MSKLPSINRKHKICVICEGAEDRAYFERLCKLGVWNDAYDFKPINAKSASNIPARYQNEFQNDNYELVLIFCDTDKEPYREYGQIKAKIDAFHGGSTPASQHMIIYANPCTMQIVLSHFGDVSLKNQGKKTNADIIEKFTGVKNYDAHKEQIEEICSKIFRRIRICENACSYSIIRIPFPAVRILLCSWSTLKKRKTNGLRKFGVIYS